MDRTIRILGFLIGAGIAANIGLALNSRFRELEQDIAEARVVWVAPCVCEGASR